MTRNVMLTISGQQIDDAGEESTIETLVPAEYFLRGNTHYVMFQETVEGFEEPVRSMLKFGGDYVELIKKGPVTARMLFEKNKKNLTGYATPYGDIQMGTDTRNVILKEGQDRIRIKVEYGLDMNGEHAADCRIVITIRASRSAEEQ